MNSNPLTGIVTGKTRAWLYSIYAGIGLVLGSVPVYCGATSTDTPVWVLGALAVYAYVGGAFGATAASNITGEGE